MATRKEVEELQRNTEELSNIIVELGEQLKKEQQEREITLRKNNDLQTINHYLEEERDRLQKANEIHMEMNNNLMYSIAVLGQNIRNNNSTQIWHSCTARYAAMITPRD